MLRSSLSKAKYPIFNAEVLDLFNLKFEWKVRKRECKKTPMNWFLFTPFLRTFILIVVGDYTDEVKIIKLWNWTATE